MTPNTDGLLQETPINDINDADQYSFLLCLKEVSFLIIILFFGFSGFSFCVKKVYEPAKTQKIEDIIIHDLDLAEINGHKSEPKLTFSVVN